MKKRGLQSFAGRGLAFVLSFAMGISGISYVPAAKMMVEAADGVITINSADELGKIGKDSNYPMNGDYVLGADIDLDGVNWVPIGGNSGPQYGLVEGDRVFSGTFDGQGHVISNLTIEFNGQQSTDDTNQTGLFAMIGSDDASDYAEVKNLVFSEVAITHTLGHGDSIGTLAGDANGYARVDNIAVVSGSIQVTASSSGKSDLIGLGGVVGQVRTNCEAVQLSNLYNGADVTLSGSFNTISGSLRCGGILGRVHQTARIGELSSCVNVGTVTYQNGQGYAINGVDRAGAADYTDKIKNCYYLNGTGQGNAAVTGLTEAELAGEAVISALGSDYWMVSNGKLVPKVTDGVVLTPIPSPVFAEGDRASAVTKNFTVPTSYEVGGSTETIQWVSSNTDVISIDGSTGVATVHPVMKATSVILTATTGDGRTKEVSVTVLSNLSLKLDGEYAKPGTALRASVQNDAGEAPAGVTFTYRWTLDGAEVSTNASYTPTENALNKFIEVTAMTDGAVVDTYRLYCSKLPVVYIDTADGYGITSKTVYKDASMRVQGNDTYNSTTTTLYDGATEIRGRGNSTWNTSYNKLPYKLKLGKKTNLFGFGESKHWALLANYMDESLMRNTISYDLAKEMGMETYLPSAHVEVVLNGNYAGNYQLVGNVRVEESRVNIFDWEDAAGDAAKAIAKKHGLAKKEQDALEDYLVENMEWITSEQGISYNGSTYPREDYESVIPTDASGNVDLSGGFLFELDAYYDEVSKFRTTYEQPFMFKRPEFVVTNQELFASAQNYIQALENSIHASDFYTTYQNESVHYTDLVDMDSLVRYFVLNEFFWNTETMKKSTYMYKDLGKKVYVGPVWDMDWTSNSLVSKNETWNYQVWVTNDRNDGAQSQQWYKYLISDPYFAVKVYECYQANKGKFEDIIKSGGIIDKNIEYLTESANSNYNAGFLRNDLLWQDDARFDAAVTRLRTFLSNRKNWMEQQCTSADALLTSFGRFKASGSITAAVDTSGEKTTLYTANVTDSTVAKVGFYVNGILAGTADVTEGTATFTASDAYLEKDSTKLNVIQVRGMDASGKLLSNGSVTNYKTFSKEVQVDTLTGTVTVSGEAKTGKVLAAAVEGSNNTGEFTYQWMADGVAITGATGNELQLTAGLAGKKIKVRVGSTMEADYIYSAETAAVELVEVKNDHVIINQVYGGGANDGTPVSHSFIELYNPTEAEIDISSYSLGYLSNGKNGPAAEEVKLSLEGKIPAHTSYLIRCEAQDASTPELIKCTIDTFDKEWNQAIDNKRYRLILYKGEAVEDAVSVNEGHVEGFALADGAISKQKSIRRTDFQDTNINQNDFETVDYREATAVSKYPRSLADGEWGQEPDVQTLSGEVSIRGNAIVGAILYADQNTNGDEASLSYQWKADGTEISGASGTFLPLEKTLEGKKISVSVTSSVMEGKVDSGETAAVKAVKAQTEHLIINQVYGTGGKKTPAMSHSFIELYNPTAGKVNLEGYSISYQSGEETASLKLTGEIPANTSYLIRCVENAGYLYEVKDSDIDWAQEISNKQYRVLLMKGSEQIDGVSVNEEAAEGTPLTNPVGDEIISKNKSIRRISFIDTDQNAEDFEVLNYSKLPEAIRTAVVPRSLKDGAWGTTSEAPNPPEPETPGTETPGTEKPTPVPTPVVLEAPAVKSVKSVIRSGSSAVEVKIGKVQGASSYRIYRKTGSKTALLGTVAGETFYDMKPVSGKATYLAEAAAGTNVSSKGTGKDITLPKATKKVTAKAAKSGSKRIVKVSWKRVKDAKKYMIFRSNKSGSGFKRIAVIKKAKIVKYTDKKVKKGKKYFYRVVAVKGKTYSPAKASKAVKVK
ncbi:CotH kinase family protein [Lachnospiraceae bacterium 46-15]